MTLIGDLRPAPDRKLPIALVAAVAIFSSPAWGDRLMPAAEMVEGYETGVTRVLKPAFTSDLDSLAIIEPSFQPEFAVGLRATDGRYRVFTVVAKEAAWPRLLEHKSLDNIGADSSEVEIPAPLGVRIAHVWDAMLRDIGPDSSPLPVDGSDYYFSKVLDGKLRVGMAWDRREDTKVGRLEVIALAMRDLCAAKGTVENLDREVAELERLLAVEKSP